MKSPAVTHRNYFAPALSLAVSVLLAASPYLQAALTDMRPALVGSGHNALVNLIDPKSLMKRGATHAAVLFRCRVETDSTIRRCVAYGGSGDWQPLKEEVERHCADARFIPAVYNHQNVVAWFDGTVTFAVVNGKPHVRMFANQEKAEIAEAHDFISPQSIAIPNHDYPPRKFPPGGGFWSDEHPTIVEMEVRIDSTGKLQDARVISGNPAEHQFAEAAMTNIHIFTFLPAFRNGRPVASTTHLSYIFTPESWWWK